MNVANFLPVKISHVTGVLFLTLLSLSGCNTTHTQFLSDHWVAQSSGLHLVSTNPRPSRLQVIITYDGPLSSHSALRLESENENVTFWDPAGAYGLVGHFTDQQGNRIRPYGTRHRDIVVTHIPDIPTYMKFRWFVGDSSVEIFEWDLPTQQTEELREILLKETDETHSQGEFHTETTPAFCSMAISDFLLRFAKPSIHLTNTYLWPHNLGEALLEESPSRIRIFIRGQEEMIYLPPHQQVVGP
jgi:hypothetical protein